MQKFRFAQNHMGTGVNITLYSQKPEEEFIEQIKSVFFAFRNAEQTYSLFLDESEISHINNRAGLKTSTSPELLQAIVYALRIAKETGGIFSPLVGQATRKNGATSYLDPEAYNKIAINQKDNSIIIPPNSDLDLNSVVKGITIDQAMKCISEDNVMIEAGGDILVKGLPPGKNRWQIGIRNPQSPDKIITILNIETGAVCTTGNYFRKELAEKENRRHLINPRDPEPFAGAPGSVSCDANAAAATASMTVTADTAREADALSTAAFFMPVDQAVEFVESHHGCSCLIIDNDNQIYMSPRMQKIFTTT